MREQIARDIVYFFNEVAQLDQHLVALVLLLVIVVIVLDGATLLARRKTEASGLTPAQEPFKIEGSQTVPVKDYVSDIQGLSGRPDALVIEDGYFIPVEVKPLAKKLRDRYVAQLLVYMRLVEEFERKRPPYGYLILGKNNRRIRIDNTEARQAWLTSVLGSMQSVLKSDCVPVPLPHPRKCPQCGVREHCHYWNESHPRTGKGRIPQG